MLQLLADILTTTIREMHWDHFYNYEAGLQSLLVKNLLQINECKVVFETGLTNNRKADIIILKEGRLHDVLFYFAAGRHFDANVLNPQFNYIIKVSLYITTHEIFNSPENFLFVKI